MPQPLLIKIKQDKTGPTPSCECGRCKTCKNRERQKRYYHNSLNKKKMGELRPIPEEEEDCV